MKTKPIIMRVLVAAASVVMLAAVGSSNAYAVTALPDFELDGIVPPSFPNFQNMVRAKVLKNGNKGYKLRVRKRGSYQYFNASPLDSFNKMKGSYNLNAFFDTDGIFLKGDVNIRGRLDTPLGMARGTLMTAELTDFAFDSDLTSSLLGFNTANIECNSLIDAWVHCTNSESVYIALQQGGFDPTLRGFRSDGLAVTSVPVPAAVWLFGSGLIALVGMTRRRKH